MNKAAYQQSGVGDELQIRYFRIKIWFRPINVWIAKFQASVAIAIGVEAPLTMTLEGELISSDTAKPAKEAETVGGGQRHSDSGTYDV